MSRRIFRFIVTATITTAVVTCLPIIGLMVQSIMPPSSNWYRALAIPTANAQNATDLESLVTRWKTAKASLKSALDTQTALTATNAKLTTQISAQKQAITTAEHTLNETIASYAEAKGRVQTAAKNLGDTKGQDLRLQLETAQKKHDATRKNSDQIKAAVERAEVKRKAAKAAVGQFDRTLTAAKNAATAAQTVAQAAKSAQQAIAQNEYDDPQLESDFSKDADAQAQATLKTLANVERALKLTNERLTLATAALTQKQGQLATANKPTKAAADAFDQIDKKYKSHGAMRKSQMSDIMAEITAAKTHLTSQAQGLEKQKDTLETHRAKLAETQRELTADTARLAPIKAEIETIRASFNEIDLDLRRVQKARAERDAIILATLNVDFHARLRVGSDLPFDTQNQIYNRVMYKTADLFANDGAMISKGGQVLLTSIVKVITSLPDRIPAGVDWVLRIDSHVNADPKDPSKSWRTGQARALQAAMIKVAQTKVLDYVEYPEPKGDGAIYEQLCKWMEYSNLRADPKSIVLCHGGQNAISVALASILSEGAGVIAIDALTYPGVRYAVQNHRAELVGIEIDDFGIVPDALETAYRRKPFKALFTSTNVLNPTTGEMPLERRIAIADLARKFDFQIIEDDCWGIGPSKLPTFTSICPERAWYLSSISKTISAGLRFGYLVCPPAGFAAASRIVQINSYGLSRAVSDIVQELLQSGSALRIRQDVLKAVGKRVELSVNLLGKWDISWRRDVPFIWLRLPQGWRASSFTSACERHDILVRPADEFALNNMPVPRAVRVSVNCNVPLARYEAALRQIDNLLSHPPLEMES